MTCVSQLDRDRMEGDENSQPEADLRVASKIGSPAVSLHLSNNRPSGPVMAKRSNVNSLVYKIGGQVFKSEGGGFK